MIGRLWCRRMSHGTCPRDSFKQPGSVAHLTFPCRVFYDNQDIMSKMSLNGFPAGTRYQSLPAVHQVFMSHPVYGWMSMDLRTPGCTVSINMEGITLLKTVIVRLNLKTITGWSLITQLRILQRRSNFSNICRNLRFWCLTDHGTENVHFRMETIKDAPIGRVFTRN